MRLKIRPAIHNLCVYIYSNPDVAPLFVHGSLWQYIRGGDKSRYCIIGNFSSQTLIGTKSGWRYFGAIVYFSNSDSKLVFDTWNQKFVVDGVNNSLKVPHLSPCRTPFLDPIGH